MPVLGAVVDHQEKPGCGEALNEAVEERLRLGVNPVQVFEHEEQGLHLALAQEEALDRIERVLAPVNRIERLPLPVLDGHVE